MVSNMSNQKKEYRKTLLLDDCFKDITAQKMIELGIVAAGKLELIYTDE